MSTTTPPRSPRGDAQQRGPGLRGADQRPTRTPNSSHVVALILGCLLLVPGVSLLLGGGGLATAYALGRDSAGYVQTTPIQLHSQTAALTVEDLVVINDAKSPPWLVQALNADVRLQVTPAASEQPVFVGIGPAAEVNAYLARTAHERIVRLTNGGVPVTATSPGNSTASPPSGQGFWTAQASGIGTQELNWTVTDAGTAVVVMNADGSPGVGVTAAAGLRAGFALPLALTLLGVGAVITACGLGLIVWATRRRRGVRDTTPPADRAGPDTVPAHALPGGFPAGTPVALTARLDPDLSRWQWLVKWFLAIPHLFVLAFLWPAFGVLTVLAGICILFTGTYPRGLFNVNLAILRYSWRVSYYATSGGLGTDQYPPFTGGPAPDYPATLDVAYPGRLSRGLVLVKWWLLAIPHYLIVGLLIGSSWGQATLGDHRSGFDSVGGALTSGGILGILVVIAAAVLLVTGAYPRALFALIIGCNRWIYRVIAYAALMTDQYPPFRLDQGGSEPADPGTPPPPAPATTGPADTRTPEPAGQGTRP